MLRNIVTFQAASCSENFTKAAAELGISRVAVSRQVAELEQAIGQRLFSRNHRKVSLTRSGEAFARSVNPAMDSIADALAQQRSGASESRLSVTVTSAFATYWLMPRLIDFGALYPDIEINLVVSDRYLDIDAELIDVAVRYSPDAPVGDRWLPLVKETIFPIFSPKYVPRTRLDTPEHLRQERLLYLSGRYRPEARWHHWFSQQGLQPPEERSGIHVNTYINMLQAAIEGQGIALAGAPLVDTYLADGTLCAMPNIAPMQRDFFYLYKNPNRIQATVFSDWLETQLKANP
ncbi:LysR substrate-binding domain-containing protein [Pelagibius litoralis]|uniref:LysR substrate-binding domain-containing protein n=1 Tax=Pelagibius litoralis TaxID=374515 RepID=UPI001982235B|nr:LysR substrate-binding domain-containing protein [Pelagibius litoralis]